MIGCTSFHASIVEPKVLSPHERKLCAELVDSGIKTGSSSNESSQGQVYIVSSVTISHSSVTGFHSDYQINYCSNLT